VSNKRTARKAAGLAKLKIAAFALLGLAALTGLSLVSLTRDPLTEGLFTLLRRSFGWGLYLVPLAAGILGFWMLLQSTRKETSLPWRRPLAVTLLFVVSLAGAHLLSFPEDPRQLAAQGGGGGYAGWLLSQALIASVGTAGAYVTVAAGAMVGLILLSGISLSRLGSQLRRGVTAATSFWGAHAPRLRPRRSSITGRGVLPGLRERLAHPFQTSPDQARCARENRRSVSRSTPTRRDWQLPTVKDVLERSVPQEASDAEIQRKVRIIEQTLLSFGVPGKVVEVNQGPTVTQFGLKPGYVERKGPDGRPSRTKVKVSKIGALANDLSLALAAAPVRIEAPVPGRSMVGIEVPNDEASLVPLRRIMESNAFDQTSPRLQVALGQDVSGQPVVADLARMPHLLIAGATGSGKSVCINSIVICLLLRNTPEDLRLLMIDPKMVELVNFNGIPHLLSPVVVEVARVVGTLRWALREMDRRYRLFSDAAARNLDHFNEELSARGGKPLPYIVVVLDELADLMMAAPDEVERCLCRLAQMSRATGMHLIVATQRPSVDVVTGLIKANFPARISFAVTSQADSRVIIDAGGAEKLLGRGDMLYVAADASSPVRLQGCFVSDREIERLVRFWKGLDVPRPAKPQELIQQELWPQQSAAAEEEVEDDDQLLDEAIRLVKREKRASTTLLQRRLGIGYVRAARLIDALEEKGIVGPAESAGLGREVLYEEEVPWPTT
jgi:S-DNA-T family DNA segregation ATPase FtsK/SpoIIIE